MRYVLLSLLLLFSCKPTERYESINVVEVQPQKLSIIAVGDSSACAISAVSDSVVKKRSDIVDYHTVCKVGSRVEYWSGRRFENALFTRPDATNVFIFLGGNNASDSSGPDVSKILETVSKHGLRCTWVGPPKLHGRRWPINERLKVTVVPTCDYFDSEDVDLRLVDGLHPDRESAIRWLNIIMDSVIKVKK